MKSSQSPGTSTRRESHNSQGSCRGSDLYQVLHQTTPLEHHCRFFNPGSRHKIHSYSQLDDNPISMTLRSTAFRLPAVTHVLSTTRQNQVRSNTEMLIGYSDNAATSEDMRKVEWSLRGWMNWYYFPIYPETSLSIILSGALNPAEYAMHNLQCHRQGACGFSHN